MMDKVYECTMSVNDFKKPLILEDRDAIYQLLVHLILLEPGTNKSHPRMGVGLVSRYRYMKEGQEKELEKEIKDQINTYLPDLMQTDVKVIPNGSNLVIAISANGVLYQYELSKQSDNIVSLKDLLNN